MYRRDIEVAATWINCELVSEQRVLLLHARLLSVHMLLQLEDAQCAAGMSVAGTSAFKDGSQPA